MKKSIQIKDVVDLLPDNLLVEDIRGRINCLPLDRTGIEAEFSTSMVIKASVAILVLSGTCSLTINHKSHTVSAHTMILLSVSHLFHFTACSDDLQCVCLLVSKDFMDETDSTDMIYRRIKYGVKLYNTPIVVLPAAGGDLLKQRLVAVSDALDQKDHLYYKELILNALFAFYLDLSNLIDRQPDFAADESMTRYESVVKAFIELLVSNYRKEHKVDFYAEQLNISAHYLTQIVKRVTGESVTDFIFEMLYSEATTLLMHSKLPVQEIATRLNFSDQSAFGKFFRRKSGISPVEFRRGQSVG